MAALDTVQDAGAPRVAPATVRGDRPDGSRQRALGEGEDLSLLSGRLQAAQARLGELSREHAELAEQAEASGRVFEALRAELAAARRALADERAGAARSMAELKERLEGLRVEGAALLLQERRDSADRLERLARDTQAALQAERAEAGAVIDALRASTSWRLTRPLRSVSFRLRRLARR